MRMPTSDTSERPSTKLVVPPRQTADVYGNYPLMCHRQALQPAAQTSALAPSPVAVGKRNNTPTAEYELQSINWELISQLRQTRPDLRASILPLLSEPRAYRIGPGDILAVAVWGYAEFGMNTLGAASTSNATNPDGAGGVGYVVSSAGDIQFPFVGRIRVAGMTETEAYAAITRALSKTLRDPQITVRIQNFRSQRIYVDGDIKSPGVYSVTDIPMTLPEALNRAGGILPTADSSRIELNRNGKVHAINLPYMVANGMNPNQIVLAAGDMVRVPPREESKVYLIGEVTRPMALTMVNGRMTLNAALGEAAGVNVVSGNARQIYVIRTRADMQAGALPAVYHLDAKSPTALILAEQFELQPKDVIYVDAAPLATWNRVISLILPSAGLLKTTQDIGKN